MPFFLTKRSVRNTTRTARPSQAVALRAASVDSISPISPAADSGKDFPPEADPPSEEKELNSISVIYSASFLPAAGQGSGEEGIFPLTSSCRSEKRSSAPSAAYYWQRPPCAMLAAALAPPRAQK